jgi:hypothetical protein
MGTRGILAAACGLALGCANASVGSRPAVAHDEPAGAPPGGPQTWALVYVLGADGALERQDEASLDWVVACTGRCGRYVPAAGTYRVRGTSAMTEPFSLPPPDLGRVVLRFDDDGHVWTRATPRGIRWPQPFAPTFVMLWR